MNIELPPLQYGMIDIADEQEALAAFKSVEVSQPGFGYMMPKALFCCLKFKAIPARAANVLKQEMLSRGGEAAVSEHALYGEGNTDVILMGTYLQYGRLSDKLRRQPFRSLQAMADAIDDCIAGLKAKTFELTFPNGVTMNLSDATKIVGILNVTPDSFSDGGCYFSPEAAVEKAWQLRADGADIIDVGAVSSRPGSELASAEEEWRRLEPVLTILGREKFLLSLDTFRADIAQKALDLGVAMINDISGFALDEKLPEVIARYRAPVILMDNRLQLNQIPYQDLMLDIASGLRESIRIGLEHGIAREQMVIDPGIGFGKTNEQNWEIIRRAKELKALGQPIMLALSRKTFLRNTLPTLDWDMATAAAGLIGTLEGVHFLRVHEVKQMKMMLQVVQAMKGNGDG